ncbi:hypothetical protein Q3G72_014761 [Acer saccharum]|nr:hypothetical protein Q3G72_014761 [Acer saccharum]
MDTNNVIAPFIMKTYQMVNDPTTDMLIMWSRANNSFIVIEPLDFSQRILPAYFKHNNFSSFVRQLNTYGFRKVDPDRWEFANEWFLRGQKQLLKNIIRRKHSKNNHYMTVKTEDLEDEEIVMEIARLKQEQKLLEEELEGMNKRLEATERRPQQMMAFLYKVVEDPDLLPRMELEKERTKKLLSPSGDKKRRFKISSSQPSSSSGMTTVSSSIKYEEEEEDSRFDIDNLCQSLSPENSISGWFGEKQFSYSCVPNTGQMPAIAAPAQGNSIAGQMGYFGDMMGGMNSTPPPPYPFSLLGGGF